MDKVSRSGKSTRRDKRSRSVTPGKKSGGAKSTKSHRSRKSRSSRYSKLRDNDEDEIEMMDLNNMNLAGH